MAELLKNGLVQFENVILNPSDIRTAVNLPDRDAEFILFDGTRIAATSEDFKQYAEFLRLERTPIDALLETGGKRVRVSGTLRLRFIQGRSFG